MVYTFGEPCREIRTIKKKASKLNEFSVKQSFKKAVEAGIILSSVL